MASQTIILISTNIASYLPLYNFSTLAPAGPTNPVRLVLISDQAGLANIPAEMSAYFAATYCVPICTHDEVLEQLNVSALTQTVKQELSLVDSPEQLRLVCPDEGNTLATANP